MRYLFFSLALFPFMAISQIKKEPKALKIPKALTIHGHTRMDDYFWMNERDSEPVLNYIEQENALSKDFFDEHGALVTEMLNEFEARINPDETSAPFETNGRMYQERFEKGKDYARTFLVDGKKEVVLLDENERAANHPYYGLGMWAPSPDNSLLALSEDFVGRRNYTISVRQYGGKKFLTDRLDETDGSLVWANDNKTLFYVKKDPVTLRSYQVYRHVLGTSQKQDVLVFQEDDEKFGVGISKSSNDRFIVIHSYSTTTSEEQLISADRPNEKPIVFLPREQGHLYEVEAHNNGFYILSNKNASNRAILFTNDIPKSLNECSTVVSHSSEILIEGISVLHSHLIISERVNGLQKIRLLDLTSNSSKYISIPEETYSLGLGYNDNYNGNYIYYRYNSMTTPATVYKYDLGTEQKEIIHRYELLDPTFSPDNYESKRVWATANDGTQIPVSLVYKKGLDLSKAPCLLYAYGSYGYTIPDVFSATRLSLLDRGFVFALAHVRGGKYMGESWYEDGKLLKKRNTFTDFVNVAEYLGMQGFCNPNSIYAQGGSAGGLLMGAVANLSPYLFKGVIAQVPFVDVVSTMLDETIPLTVGEYEEWGDPNDPLYYYYMLSYSPYDNLRKMDYPNLLITTGYHDSQVQYWEPLKWIAKLREYRTNNNLLLLDCNMDAGHGGGSGRSNERLEKAKEFAFILALEGLH